jgi:hypothetical protein
MIIFFLCSLFILTGYSQKKGIFINVVQKNADTVQFVLPANYQNGYRKSVFGQAIDYHSSHPDADKALLVRAKQDVGSIIWESDTLTEVEGEYYNLIWIRRRFSGRFRERTEVNYLLSRVLQIGSEIYLDI